MNRLASLDIKKIIIAGLLCTMIQSLYGAMFPGDYIGVDDEPEVQQKSELAPLSAEQLATMSEEEQIAYITKLSEQEEESRRSQEAASAQELKQTLEMSRKEEDVQDEEIAQAIQLSIREQRRAERKTRREQRRLQAVLQTEAQEELKVAASAVCLDRNLLFENVMGMSEDDFRQLFAKYPPEHKSKSAPKDVANYKPNVKAINRWFMNKKNLNRHPRSYAVTQGTLLPYISLKQLRKTIYQQYKNCPMGTGTLRIITPPDETDIRRLHELYPHAFFMIASNFNALEGGMGHFDRHLNGMNHSPVQGEEAALATMGAAIHRRYCVSRINQLKDLQHIFTLQGIDPYEEDLGLKPFIFSKVNPKQPLTRKDMEGFAVTLHQDITVTSGASADPQAPDRTLIPRADGKRQIPACNKELPTQGPDIVTVSHILTSAHDLAKVARDTGIKPGTPEYEQHIEIAKAILGASYEATILTAMEYGADQLILTLIGASAFRNKAEWIVETLEQLIPVIVASNIDIKIVLFENDPGLQIMIENVIAKIEQYRHTGNQSQELNRLLNI